MVMVAPGESERDFTRRGAGVRHVVMPYCCGVCGKVASGENIASRGGSTVVASSANVIGGISGERDIGIGGEIIEVGDE